MAATTAEPSKLPRIPSTHKISKRPVMRPAIPSPYTNQKSPKVVYITRATRFMSAVRRSEKLLTLIAKRERSLRGPTDEDILAVGRVGNTRTAAFHAARRKKADRSQIPLPPKPEKIYLKATGRAIHHLLEIALWFQGRSEYRVHVTTGTEGVVDDILQRTQENRDGNEHDVAGEQKHGEGDAMDMDIQAEVPDTRIRMLSVVTVAVGWK